MPPTDTIDKLVLPFAVMLPSDCDVVVHYVASFSKFLMSSLLIRYRLPIFLAWSLCLRIQSHTVNVLTWYLSAIWAQVYSSNMVSPSSFVYCYTCVYYVSRGMPILYITVHNKSRHLLRFSLYNFRFVNDEQNCIKFLSRFF